MKTTKLIFTVLALLAIQFSVAQAKLVKLDKQDYLFAETKTEARKAQLEKLYEERKLVLENHKKQKAEARQKKLGTISDKYDNSQNKLSSKDGKSQPLKASQDARNKSLKERQKIIEERKQLMEQKKLELQEQRKKAIEERNQKLKEKQNNNKED